MTDVEDQRIDDDVSSCRLSPDIYMEVRAQKYENPAVQRLHCATYKQGFCL